MVNEFLDWVQEQQDVWIVSNEQLLAWVQNPVPVSQLDSFEPLKCPTPQVDPSLNICNGIPQNEAGLLEVCDFPDFPFYTCVSCACLVWAYFSLFSESVWLPGSGGVPFKSQSTAESPRGSTDEIQM